MSGVRACRDPEDLRRLARQEIDRLTPYISQRRLERLLGLSQGYLSRLRSFAGTPSATLVCTLTLLAQAPKERLHELTEYWEQLARVSESLSSTSKTLTSPGGTSAG
jgi:hypothetical protein